MIAPDLGWIERVLRALPREQAKPENDIARAERLILALSAAFPADVDWAAGRLLPPSRLRALALLERDVAVRAGLSFFAPAPRKTAARRLVAALRIRAAGATWRGSPTLAILCDRILAKNGGKSLGLRRVFDISDGEQIIGAQKNCGACTADDASQCL